MQNLINELYAPIVEWKDDLMHTRPPTTLQLKAARAIKLLMDTANRTDAHINTLISQHNQDQEIIGKLNDSLRQSREQTSTVECGYGQPSVSDSDSKGDTEEPKDVSVSSS